MNSKPIIAFFSCCFIAGCTAESPETDSELGSTKTPVSTLSKSKPWVGDARGYIASADPTTDRIALFVRIGTLLAAAHVYRIRAQDALSIRNPSDEQTIAAHSKVAAALDDALLASISDIEPLIQQKMRESKQQFALQDLVLELSGDQQISDIVNGDRAQRDKQIAARQKVFALFDRIHSAVLAFFPSRHEYLLASSALIRQAGDKAALAISANGVIVNVDLLKEATELIDRSMKLNPKNVTFCESQRLAMRAHKDAINELLNKMVPLKIGAKLSVTASDVYRLADQAQTAGERLPIKDSEECR